MTGDYHQYRDGVHVEEIRHRKFGWACDETFFYLRVISFLTLVTATGTIIFNEPLAVTVSNVYGEMGNKQLNVQQYSSWWVAIPLILFGGLGLCIGYHRPTRTRDRSKNYGCTKPSEWNGNDYVRTALLAAILLSTFSIFVSVSGALIDNFGVTFLKNIEACVSYDNGASSGFNLNSTAS